MIDIVVIRDPDASNEYHVFPPMAGVMLFDIDLGRADLSDPAEFDEWAEALANDVLETTTGGAATIIAEIVRGIADDYGHHVPGWAA